VHRPGAGAAVAGRGGVGIGGVEAWGHYLI